MTTFFPTGTPSQSASGNLASTSSNGGIGDFVQLTTDTLNSVNFSLVGTPTGAVVTFEGTVDGVNWYSLKAYSGPGGNPGSTTASTAGTYNVSCGGAKEIRARLTAITSGQFSVTAYGTAGLRHVGVKNDNASDLNATVTISGTDSQFGTDGTGITQPTGGGGIRGWLSGIYKALTGTLSIAQTIGGSVISPTNPVPIYDGYQAPATVSWTSATSVNSTQTLTTQGYDTVILTIAPSGTITGGAITFEVYDGTNWLSLKAPRTDSYLTDTTVQLSGFGVHSWQLGVAGYPQVRARLSTAITGTGSVSLVSIVSSAPDVSLVTVGMDPNQPLPAGTNALGSVQIINGFTPTGSTGPGTITSANTDQIILAANANRRTVMIQNQHASATLYVYPGTAAWSGSALQGLLIQAGQVLSFDVAVATSAFHAASATASCPFFVFEG